MGESFKFKIECNFPIQDEGLAFRHGKKMLKDGDYAYHIAQWYPRMCGYFDRQGWQVKPYIGYGEFALEFGRFDVEITIPSDFVVPATGELTNSNKVLTSKQKKRLSQAESSEVPVFIVTAEEAAENLKERSTGKITWSFRAEQVRDFSFAASRGYLWNAKGIEIEAETVMVLSAYPQDAAALWKPFSTESAVQALRSYSKYVFPYPYPVMWSAWGPIGGMKYPMMTFQSSWDIDDKDTCPIDHRNYVIGLTIHEVGHNWFPMIINSDEREWVWLDEGLNTFVEQITAPEFDLAMRDSYRDGVKRTIKTMSEANDPPIVRAADNETNRGHQAYNEPALGLSILRESILGPELFDFAFREYGRCWAFKRPSPADFFARWRMPVGSTSIGFGMAGSTVVLSRIRQSIQSLSTSLTMGIQVAVRN